MDASGLDQGAGRAESAAALGHQQQGNTAAAASSTPVSESAEAAMATPALHKPWYFDEFVWDSSALTATPIPQRLRLGTSDAAAPRRAAGAAGSSDSPLMKAEAEEAAPTTAALPVWPEASSPPLLSPRGGRAPPACQVCGVDVSRGLKDYYARYKICPQHCTMPCIVRNGEHLRFCQQASAAGATWHARQQSCWRLWQLEGPGKAENPLPVAASRQLVAL